MFTVPRKRPDRSGAICLGCGGLATFLAPGRGTYGLVRSADQTVPGLWPNGCCDPVAAAEFQRSSRGRSCPPEAETGQKLPSRGRSRAAAAAATAGRCDSRSGSRGSNRRSRPGAANGSCQEGERFLQFGRADTARTQGSSRLRRAVAGGGSCPTAGQHPPRSGGCCAGAV